MLTAKRIKLPRPGKAEPRVWPRSRWRTMERLTSLARAAACVVPALSWFAAPAVAVVSEWNTNSSGNFTAASNWNAGAPGEFDSAVFQRGAGATYTVTFPGHSIIQGGTEDYFNDRLRIRSNNVTFAESTAPNLGRSTYTLTNGDPADYAMIVGEFTGEQAVLTSNLQALNTTNLILGYGVGATGTLNISGGLLNMTGDTSIGGTAGLFQIGAGGNGTLNVTNGGQITSPLPFQRAFIAGGFGSTGTARISGAGSKWTLTGEVYVGFNGLGSLIIENGGRFDMTGTGGGDYAKIWSPSSGGLTSSALVTGSGSMWTIANGLNVGVAFYPSAFTVQSGGTTTCEYSWISGNSRATVRDAGSTWTVAGELLIGQETGDTINSYEGDLSISNGGVVNSGSGTVGGTHVTRGFVSISGAGSTWNTGTLNVGNKAAGELHLFSGGQVVSNECNIVSGLGNGLVELTGNGSKLSATGSVGVGSAFSTDTGNGTLTVGAGSTVEAGLYLSVRDRGTLNIFGGTVIADAITHIVGTTGGAINFSSGTIRMTGSTSLRGGIDLAKAMGDAYLLSAGRNLVIDGTAYVETPVLLEGGSLTVQQLAGIGGNPAPSPGMLNLSRGTLSITNQPIVIETAGVLGSSLDVASDMTINTTLGMTNRGLLRGDGRIGGPVSNASVGEIRAETGRSLTFSGPSVTNAGRINLMGGTLEFAQGMTNSVAGVITGNGNLITGTGLTNAGQLRLTGDSNVFGPITNNAWATIINSGSATFHDPVVNNGELRTSPGSQTVFFANLSGNGFLSGGGTRVFEAGNSNIWLIEAFGSTVVEWMATLQTYRVRDNELTVRGAMGIFPGQQVNVVSDLTIDGFGTIDLADNVLVVENGSVGSWMGSKYDGVSGLVASGRNGGLWNGPGLWTSMSDAGPLRAVTTLGVAMASDVGKTSLGGISVAATDVLVMYTYAGDADLDGDIDGDDFFRIDNGFQQSLRGYANGDFNYTGSIDADDYWLIDRNYSRQLPALGASPPAGVTSMPEPGTGLLGIAFAGACAWCSCGRRRPQIFHEKEQGNGTN